VGPPLRCLDAEGRRLLFTGLPLTWEVKTARTHEASTVADLLVGLLLRDGPHDVIIRPMMERDVTARSRDKVDWSKGVGCALSVAGTVVFFLGPKGPWTGVSIGIGGAGIVWSCR